MRILSLLLFGGFVFYSSSFSISDHENLDWHRVVNRKVMLVDHSDEDTSKQLFRKIFLTFMNMVQTFVDSQVGVAEKVVLQLKEYPQTLEKNGIEMTEQDKDLFHEVTEKVMKYCQKVLQHVDAIDPPNVEEDTADDNDVMQELRARIRVRFQQLVERAKYQYTREGCFGENYFVTIRSQLQKLELYKVDIGEKGRTLLEELKKSANTGCKKILNILSSPQ